MIGTVLTSKRDKNPNYVFAEREDIHRRFQRIRFVEKIAELEQKIIKMELANAARDAGKLASHYGATLGG